MGHQISAGGKSIRFSAGAWLVRKWCDTVTPEPRPPAGATTNERCAWYEQRMGVTDIGADAVVAADAVIPMTYRRAFEQGYLTGSYRFREEEIDEREFYECRFFLRNAARLREGIHGSY